TFPSAKNAKSELFPSWLDGGRPAGKDAEPRATSVSRGRKALMERGLRDGPLAFHSRSRQLERLGGLVDGQAGEELELNDATQALVERVELRKRPAPRPHVDSRCAC